MKTSMALHAINRKLPLFDTGAEVCLHDVLRAGRKTLTQTVVKRSAYHCPQLRALMGIRIAPSYSFSLMFHASESSIRNSIHVCNSATTTETSGTRVSPIRF